MFFVHASICDCVVLYWTVSVPRDLNLVVTVPVIIGLLFFCSFFMYGNKKIIMHRFIVYQNF